MTIALSSPQISEQVTLEPKLTCSIGIMAYNEEANIGHVLRALLEQQTTQCEIAEIIVLASGCTDQTEAVVQQFCAQEPRVKLVVQAQRQGKASAVNLFLRCAQADILVMESADTIPTQVTIEHLIAPFVDPDIGMTGGHPMPVNDPRTFMGYAVNLLWELHHRIALEQPKLGELTAFRRVFHRIPLDSAVDEANMEPLIRGQGYRLRYVPEAVVYNRGAETVKDFLKQRRRIHAGHLRMHYEQGYNVATMNANRILWTLLKMWRWDWRYFVWTPAVIGLEMYGRWLGRMDMLKKRNHAIWDIAVTTKGGIE